MFPFSLKYVLFICSILAMIWVSIQYESITFYTLLWYISIGILLFIPIKTYFFFTVWLGLLFVSNIVSFFYFPWEIEFLVFSFYFFILWIFDLGRERYEYILAMLEKRIPLENILIFSSIIIIWSSLYFVFLASLLGEIAFIFALIFSYRNNILYKKKR